MAVRVKIPHDWAPRPYQLPFCKWFFTERKGLRAMKVWHRRSGKDSTDLNLLCSKMHQRIGNYWYILPEAEQARKAVWDAIDGQGRRIIDQVFPKEIRKNVWNNEMKIELLNGSMIQLVGSDNYNSLMGSNPVGVVFSEYSLTNPAAWDYVRPILTENGGWAVFNCTPRGKNHAYRLFRDFERLSREKPELYFTQLLTVEDTGIVSPEAIQAERESGMDEDLIQQEYFCSWEGVQQGTIYGKYMETARREGRIGSIPYDRRHPVNTFWDIGRSDGCAVIAHQHVSSQDRFIAAYEAVGVDTAHMVAKLQTWVADRGFVYGEHYLPHDARNKTIAAMNNPLGEDVWTQLLNLGLRNLRQVNRVADIWTGINTTRNRFSTAYIDDKHCSGLIAALEGYHRKWDPRRGAFQDHPVKDWTSEYVDAFRQWAQGYKGPQGQVGQFTLPNSLPSRPGSVPRITTVGNKRSGY